MIVTENTNNLFYRLITERFSKWELESIVNDLDPKEQIPFLNEILYLFKQQPKIYWKNVCFCYNKTGLVYPNDLGKTYFENGEKYQLDNFFGTMGVYLDDIFETANTYDIHTEMFVNSFLDSVNDLIKYLKNKNKFQPHQPEKEIHNLSEVTKSEFNVIDFFKTNDFDYRIFFNNIEKFDNTQILKLIQKETNNFDVFLICRFYSEFLTLVCGYGIDNIKYNNLNLIFPENNIDQEMLISLDNNYLPYHSYTINKGVFEKKSIVVKYDLKEPIPLIYYASLYDFLWYLETIILNYATKEQLNSITTQKPEPETLDLSDTSAVEKIIYLNELGIIDFLKTKPEFLGSTNLMATVLSAITDVKATTLQTSLNKLINNDTDDRNHPYRTTNTVGRVRQT